MPEGIVWYLNTLMLGDEEVEESYQAFLADCEQARAWLEYESEYTLHDKEAGQFENLRHLWSRVEEKLEGGEVDELASTLVEIAVLMHRIGVERDRGHFSPLPAVNRLVQSGAALLQARGSEAAVRQRLTAYQGLVQELQEVYLAAREDVPEPCRVDLEKGLSLMRQGAERVSEALAGPIDEKLMRQALSDAHTGGELMDALVSWRRQTMERLLERCDRFRIPMLGPQLEMELETAREQPRERWSPLLSRTLNESLPELESAWELVGATLIAPAEQRVALLEEATACLERIGECYADLLDPECEVDSALEELENALVAASEAFVSVAEAALTESSTCEPLVRGYMEVVRGVLGGTVPLWTLRQMQSHDPPPAGASLLSRYWDTLEPEFLLDALCEMVARYPRRADSEADGARTCSFCGNANPAGPPRCLGCGARLG